jgi:hypothetical protein
VLGASNPRLGAGLGRACAANPRRSFWRAAAAVPVHGIGANPDGLTAAGRIKAVDFRSIFQEVPINPFLVERAVVHGFIPVPVTPRTAKEPPVAGAQDHGPMPLLPNAYPYDLELLGGTEQLARALRQAYAVDVSLAPAVAQLHAGRG